MVAPKQNNYLQHVSSILSAVTTVFLALAAPLFFASSFLERFASDGSDIWVLSAFGLETKLHIVCICLLGAAVITGTWAKTLKSTSSLKNTNTITKIIVSQILFILGIAFVISEVYATSSGSPLNPDTRLVFGIIASVFLFLSFLIFSRWIASIFAITQIVCISILWGLVPRETSVHKFCLELGWLNLLTGASVIFFFILLDIVLKQGSKNKDRSLYREGLVIVRIFLPLFILLYTMTAASGAQQFFKASISDFTPSLFDGAFSEYTHLDSGIFLTFVIIGEALIAASNISHKKIDNDSTNNLSKTGQS